MDTSTIAVDDIVAAIRQTEVDTEQRRAEAARIAEQAARARAKADQLEDTAGLLDQQAGRPSTTALYALMRTLTEEVAAARVAAVNAIRTGDQPALDVWLTYRRIRARNHGTWDALRSEYERITGRPGPPGAGAAAGRLPVPAGL